MNRGSIPGYYYDEEKKKYFKIQANHKAPPNAKYSKTNAARETSESKRRNVDDDKRRVLQGQTVTRSQLLGDPLIGGSVLREHGGLASFASHQSMVVARGLKGSSISQFTMGEDKTLFSLHRLHNHVVFTVGRAAFTAIYRFEHAENDPSSHFFRPKDEQLFFVMGSQYVATRTTTISGVPYVLGCCSGPEEANVYFGDLTSTHRPTPWKLPDQVNGCVVNRTSHHVAFAGSRLVAVRSLLDNEYLSWIALPHRVESAAVEWIDAHTLAFGSSKSTYGKKQKVTREHSVMLWDTRVNSNKCADGTASRLNVPRRITGMERSDDSGNNLIVTTNHSINLYDLRILRKDQPLLSFDHQSEGIETYTSTHNGDLLASIDERQRVQLYSLRSGKHLKTLTNQHSGPMRDLQWYEGWQTSPFLQACCGDSVQTWS